MTDAELRERLDAVLGIEDRPSVGRDPVNQPMIRHWCDAVGDRNPVYTDPDFAARSVHGGIVAPPTMLQAWVMLGLVPEDQRLGGGPLRDVMNLLDAAGYTSVVATNCQQEYRRYLKPGDLITLTSQVVAVSDEKKTALGAGRFVDQLMVYTDQRGEEVARQRWRILKFKPRQAAQAQRQQQAQQQQQSAGAPRAARRPRPSISRDNAFFWEGVEQRELRIQRCARCKQLRHPPGPMCPSCHSLEWDFVRASGRGEVFSYVVAHHPPVPPFQYPHVVVLVELEEGTRLVSHFVSHETGAEVGMPVQVAFTEVEPGLVLPLFQPAA